MREKEGESVWGGGDKVEGIARCKDLSPLQGVEEENG